MLGAGLTPNGDSLTAPRYLRITDESWYPVYASGKKEDTAIYTCGLGYAGQCLLRVDGPEDDGTRTFAVERQGVQLLVWQVQGESLEPLKQWVLDPVTAEFTGDGQLGSVSSYDTRLSNGMLRLSDGFLQTYDIICDKVRGRAVCCGIARHRRALGGAGAHGGCSTGCPLPGLPLPRDARAARAASGASSVPSSDWRCAWRMGPEPIVAGRLLFSSDTYWDWRATHAGAPGAIGGPFLLHICKGLPCDAQPPRRRDESARATAATFLDREKIEVAFDGGLALKAEAVWPERLFSPRARGGGRSRAPRRASRPKVRVAPPAGPFDELRGQDALADAGKPPSDHRTRQETPRRMLVEAMERLAEMAEPAGRDAEMQLQAVLPRAPSRRSAASQGEACSGSTQELASALFAVPKSSVPQAAGSTGGSAVGNLPPCADGSGLPRRLATGRARCRKLATELPGKLSELALGAMGSHLGNLAGDMLVVPTPPTALRHLLTARLPQDPAQRTSATPYLEMQMLTRRRLSAPGRDAAGRRPADAVPSGGPAELQGGEGQAAEEHGRAGECLQPALAEGHARHAPVKEEVAARSSACGSGPLLLSRDYPWLEAEGAKGRFHLETAATSEALPPSAWSWRAPLGVDFAAQLAQLAEDHWQPGHLLQAIDASAARVWSDSKKSGLAPRSRPVARQAIEEARHILAVVGLDYLHGGRCREAWKLHRRLSQGRQRPLAFLQEGATSFAGDPFGKIVVPFAGEVLAEAENDYAGATQPPKAECATTLEALDFGGPDFADWLSIPSEAPLPKEGGPDPLLRTRVSVESEPAWRELWLSISGPFAVEKRGAPSPGVTRATRLMLAMGSGSALLELRAGEAAELARSMSWVSLHLREGELLLAVGGDLKGASFFVLRAPATWHPCRMVGMPLPGALFVRLKRQVYLVPTVIALGWILVAPVYQHIHRRLRRLRPPSGASLPPRPEWRKGEASPIGHVYIDDFDTPETVAEARARQQVRAEADLPQCARAACRRAGVAHSAGEAHLHRLRTWRRDADAFEFRRPLFGLLSPVWALTGARAVARYDAQMVGELIFNLVLLPVTTAPLRSHVDGMTAVSGASEFGGGVCASANLRLEAHVGPAVSRTASAAHDVADHLGVGARLLGAQMDPRVDWGDVVRVVSMRVAGAGGPRQNLARLDAGGGGPRERRSSLLLEVPWIIDLLRLAFGARLHTLLDTVAGLSEANVQAIARRPKVVPHLFCSPAFVPCRRPRLYWLSGQLRLTARRSGADGGPRLEVIAAMGLTIDLGWEDAGWRQRRAACPVPRARVLQLALASSRARDRWQANSFCFHVVLYDDRYLGFAASEEPGRLPGCEEREGPHTAAATKVSNSEGAADARCLVLGSSSSAHPAAWASQHELQAEGALARPATIRELAHGGERCEIWNQCGTFEGNAGCHDTEESRRLVLRCFGLGEWGGLDTASIGACPAAQEQAALLATLSALR
ncbi:unnamed protein product [Prorocentrum cordatum]|uniref:Uncharacterized protein n=1 Tax=Prorocentrum cordatum TaxID=2364126 RepID=A0ABN9T1F8_9DINO|nr:unnamed protein product [Polarella glacialis]